MARRRYCNSQDSLPSAFRLVLLVCLAVHEIESQNPPFGCGECVLPCDVTVDGFCNIQDIVEILSVLTGTAEASVEDACFLITADLTSDGLANIQDVVGILDLITDGGAEDLVEICPSPTSLPPSPPPSSPPPPSPPPEPACSTDTCFQSTLYPDDWKPLNQSVFSGNEPTGAELFLQDYSYAGFRRSEEQPPDLDQLEESDLPVISVLDYGADSSGVSDNTGSFQAAIDAAAQLPLRNLSDLVGSAPFGTYPSIAALEQPAFRAVVKIPAGLYLFDDILQIQSSGIILRGSGPASTGLYFTRSQGMTDTHHISFRGKVTQPLELPLLADAVATSHQVFVQLPASGDSLEIGMDVSVGIVITPEFIAEHGMTGTWTVALNKYREMFRRRIVDIQSAQDGAGMQGLVVTLDGPIRYPLKMRDFASLRCEQGYLANSAVADLSLSTAVPDWDSAWENDRSHAISFYEAKDCWVDNVQSVVAPFVLGLADGYNSHLQSGGIIFVRSKDSTIQSCSMGKPQNRGGGGNGYLFEVMRSNHILIKDCQAEEGRHNFIQNFDFGTSGCVFLRTFSQKGKAVSLQSDKDGVFGTLGRSEYHHSLAMGNLVDNSTVLDGWKAANRGSQSSGAGHTSTQNVFWNMRGNGDLVSYQYGTGYVIGTESSLEVDIDINFFAELFFGAQGTSPEDYVEGLGQGPSLNPQSLFDDQLKKRLALV